MAQTHIKSFNRKLRSFRKARNMRAADVAEILGCSITYVGYIEHGQKPMTESHILKWLEWLTKQGEPIDEWCRLYRVQPKALKPQWWSVEERETVLDLLDGMFDHKTLLRIRKYINNLKRED